ncbi:MAG: M20 peptidase family dipeptidase [Deltaproteobacteria bacterium]|nr:MAG: M20 peptidase family dipeptidase [Deltaproteobacteria bacterium]
MTQKNVTRCAEETFESGTFFNELARRVAIPTESQNPERSSEIHRFLMEEMTPYLRSLGFECHVFENTVMPRLPFLLGKRIENGALPTVLIYGHGDTVWGMEGKWEDDLSPWQLTERGDRWYGRGTADNKGQLSINLTALACLLSTEGKLGFNAIVLIETGEEMGSPGLRELCERKRNFLKADVLIASDGPRVNPGRVTLYGGSRGVFNFDLVVKLREGAHHSGNWGGLLANPGILLANAIAALVDEKGRILVEELKPDGIPAPIREALAKLHIPEETEPPVDPWWGEPGLSLEEKVYGWNTLEVLAISCGNPDNPVHAIPPEARARCHMRFVKGCDSSLFLPAIRNHLDGKGLTMVEVRPVRESQYTATRMEPDNPWIKWALASLERGSGKPVDFLPNLGGSIPNEVFADILGLPTLWIPHSYTGCSQHAPNEHLLKPIVREGLRVMATLFQDFSEGQTPFSNSR